MWKQRGVSNACSIGELRLLAKRKLPPGIFDFFDGAAEDEVSLEENIQAFRRLRLLPRPLVDVSSVDLSTTILGARSELPIAIAPTGGPGFGRHGSDGAIARAAAEAGIPYTLSTSATASIERIAREAPGRLWFQAYILRNREFLNGLLARALAADYEALMITVDLPVGGKRERDARNRMSFPFRFSARHLRDFAFHPRWLLAMARHGMPVIENLIGLETQATSASRIASSVGRSYDPSFDWDRLKEMRDNWPRRMIVKGILHPDDADCLAAMGIDAIVVSNHGGRQLDGSVAPIDALPGVVASVAGRAEVWMDSGVRRGSDVVKACALGASAVLIGRATLFGAFAGLEEGASRAITIFADELERTMQLCGVRTVGEIGSGLIFRDSR
ncbi:alpha-hydroxy-acid oxidizing protein [Sphingomonas sp. MG17]|uniref:Alpha-hydroxy-acid oxidizing protein n=1 Tax=Sphingomonas tagetis TaxID=2949092 RepID=A0A9X2KRP9_9SPHN|nr:alpha-hydroxy acid oxidase [Sphingomonas tagetis]MCP3733018.1 alpha-hydroxy-acid oxidizing protein [Sphingomonas tagetis]